MESESSGGATSEREREKETKGHCRDRNNSYGDRGNRLASKNEVNTVDSVVPENQHAIGFCEKDLGDILSSKGADKMSQGSKVVSLDNSDDDGVGSSASDATIDSIVKANSRGDAQQQNVVKNKTTSEFKTESGEAVSSPEKKQRSISDDEISRLRLDKNGIQLKKTLQSEIQVVKGVFLEAVERVEERKATSSSRLSCEDAVDSAASPSVSSTESPTTSRPLQPNQPVLTSRLPDTSTANDSIVEVQTLSRTSSSSFSPKKGSKLFVQEPSSSSSCSSSPPKSPVLSDEEYEEYLPEAVEESAIIFGVSQSASSASSEESLVVSPVVETASIPSRETVEKLPCGCMKETVRADLNQNLDRRFKELLGKTIEYDEEYGEYDRYLVDTRKPEHNLVGVSVEKLVSLQSFGHREKIIETAEGEFSGLLSRTSSSLTIHSSSGELDFDEEMQIRELLQLQEGVVAAEAALAAAEDEETGSTSFSDAWGRCLSCFKKAC